MKIFLTLIFLFVISACTRSLSKQEITEYSQLGSEISQAAAKNLGSNLMKKMKEGGPKKAIPFCNVKAIPLTEDISLKYNVLVKRTSDKIRNNQNSATQEESKIIDGYKASISKKEALAPVVNLDNSGKPHFYAPILLQKKCLKCHGDIGKETDSLIKSLYPNDLATGFKENELRGIWSITFNE